MQRITASFFTGHVEPISVPKLFLQTQALCSMKIKNKSLLASIQQG